MAAIKVTTIYKYKNNQPIVWFHKDRTKSNRFCLYCAIDLQLSDIVSNREHLIGTEFVPRGSFGTGQAFNFIFRACKRCNDEKGKLDRHVSSVTLVSSRACANDHQALESAKRKANKDYHPDKKGVLIKDSNENHQISTQLSAGVNMSADLVSSPQLNRDYAFTLAFRHIQGLFSLITSSDPQQPDGTRLLLSKHFKVFEIYKDSDWGNPQLQEVISRSNSWSCRANILTANGYFKAIMKRDDENNSGWFWALEWNKSYRIVGFISSPDEVPEIFCELPELIWMHVSPTTKIRREVPLNAENDTLFDQDVISS